MAEEKSTTTPTKVAVKVYLALSIGVLLAFVAVVYMAFTGR